MLWLLINSVYYFKCLSLKSESSDSETLKFYLLMLLWFSYINRPLLNSSNVPVATSCTAFMIAHWHQATLLSSGIVEGRVAQCQCKHELILSFDPLCSWSGLCLSRLVLVQSMVFRVSEAVICALLFTPVITYFKRLQPPFWLNWRGRNNLSVVWVNLLSN